jgi:replicative DNA helicase
VRRPDPSPLTQLVQRVDALTDGAPAIDTVATRFPSIDRALGGGVRRGDLLVLGGDVGSGKSALLLAIALRMAQDGARVVHVSGEMGRDRLLERALASEARVPLTALQQGALDDLQRAAVGAVALRMQEQLPRLVPMPRGGVSALRDLLTREPLPEVLVLDALPALALGAAADPMAQGMLVAELKHLALELQVGVLLAAPVPGLTRDRPDRRPTLDDFGAAGLIGQVADVVFALYREALYEPVLGSGTDGATELLVRKHRSGATGYLDLYFFAPWLRFEDLLDPDR